MTVNYIRTTFPEEWQPEYLKFFTALIFQVDHYRLADRHINSKGYSWLIDRRITFQVHYRLAVRHTNFQVHYHLTDGQINFQGHYHLTNRSINFRSHSQLADTNTNFQSHHHQADRHINPPFPFPLPGTSWPRRSSCSLRLKGKCYWFRNYPLTGKPSTSSQTGG